MLFWQLVKSITSQNSGAVRRYLSLKPRQLTNAFITRRVHVVPQRLAKIYMDRENVHAHQVLQESPKSYQLFSVRSERRATELRTSQDVLKETTQDASASDMFESFKTICNTCRQTNTLISHEQYHDFVQQFCDIIHKLTDDQLKESLRALSQLPQEENVRAPNFVELWNNLDIECCRRIEKWDTDELLLICDAWYSLNLARICEFVFHALRKIGRKVIKMQPSQLVQTMFLCNVMRQSISEMFDFESNLAKCAADLSLSELGVMSMGFFKTQTLIRNPDLINYLYERLMAEVSTADDITFVAILKILRYSSKLPQADIMMKLLDKIYAERSDHMNLFTALHTALLGCDIQCCHDGLIEKIITKFCNEIDTARLKDLERMSFVISLLNIHTTHKIEELLCQKIMDSLQSRIDEIVQYPKCFTNCLHFLTLRGYYDKEMISTALGKKFLKHAVGARLSVSREIFHLDTFIKINLQNEKYDGDQLTDKNRKTMGTLLTQYIPVRNSKHRLTFTDNLLLQVKEAAASFLPHNQLMHILPNYDRADVVICYDLLNRNSVPISESCPEHYSGVILTRDHLLAERNHKDIATVAIVIAGWNNVVRDKNRNTGLFDMKLHQLQLLGHKPVVIYFHEWRQLETHQDRIQFVKRRLSSILNLYNSFKVFLVYSYTKNKVAVAGIVRMTEGNNPLYNAKTPSILRYSSKLPQADIMMKLLDKIYAERSDHMNLFTALHTALLGCDIQCCHDGLIEKIITKFCNEIDTARLKDLERMSFVISLLNIHTTHKIEELLCQKIMDSLQSRIDEIVQYPKCFTNCLHFLTLRGYYDKEMISTALGKKFLKHAVGARLSVSREIFHLDTFIKINLQNEKYDGDQLTDKNRKTMGTLLTQYIPVRNSKHRLTFTDNLLLQVKEAAASFLPHNQLMHILPNYDRADVVICYDLLNRNSVPISESCPEHYSGVILTRDHLLAERNHKDIATVAIVIAGWNNVVRDKNRNTGLFDMKLHQLQLLGHKPVVIYFHEWRQLETHQDRIQFVKRRLSSILNL